MVTKWIIVVALVLFILYHIHTGIHSQIDDIVRDLRCWINERNVQSNDWECFQEVQPLSSQQAEWNYEWDPDDPIVDQWFLLHQQRNDPDQLMAWNWSDGLDEEDDDHPDAPIKASSSSSTGPKGFTGLDPRRIHIAMYWKGKRVFPQPTKPVSSRALQTRPNVTAEEVHAIKWGGA